MKKILLLTFLIFICLCATPALATALKSLDSGLIFDFGPKFFETESASLILLGASLFAIASFTRRKIRK